jgi:two-component system chemotaxis response regulator CheY
MEKVILIVDDSRSLRMAVADVLKEHGYDIVEATDGRDGIGKLDGRKYNLIISDYNMPHMNGLEFVAACRNIEQYKYTPIIMMTTESDDEKKKLGKNFGVRIWMKKPFVPDILLNTVSVIVLP